LVNLFELSEDARTYELLYLDSVYDDAAAVKILALFLMFSGNW